MSQYVETACRAFTAGGAIGQYLRVKTPGALALAGASDVAIGTAEESAFASGDVIAVRLANAQGTRKMVAAGAISAGSVVYAAADGQVDDTGTVIQGRALEAATNAGDIIEVMPLGANTLDAGTVTETGTQTLTNKTLTAPVITSPSVTDATEVVAATNVITAAESGKTFFLNHATEFVSTLPAPAAGLRYTFICANAPESASYTIVTNSSANIIIGQVYSSDLDAAGNADFETSGADTITFVDAKAVVGDRVEVFCDGTNWYAYCFCSVFDAITLTTAS